MTKIPVYFMPGLAASSAIFERIQLDEIVFEIHMLEWEIPLQRETLHSYAKRMASKIEEENVVLVGVSFGGVLVQEMAPFLKVRKLIIISRRLPNQPKPISWCLQLYCKILKS
jgi:pimeloyl-ACP methyl ester carboxylesterase